MPYKKTICLAVLLTIICTFGGAVYATDESDLTAGKERVLNGHSFMHSQFIEDPFVGTYFANHVGAATAPSFSRDFQDLDGNVLFTLDGNVVFASLGMEFQQHVGQAWAMGFGGSGLVRSGSDAPAFINEGANVNTNLNAWTKRKLLRTEKSQLTAGLAWHYSTVTFFTPREFARHLIDGGSLDTAPFVLTGKTWDLQADVLWAYALNATYAVRATGSFGVAETYTNDSVLVGKNQVGLMGEVDFKDRFGVPVGITLGHFLGFPKNGNLSGLSGTLLGFWYTGRTNFVIGLETGWLEIPTGKQADTIDGAFGTINLKYYF